ncbi:MAG: DUF1653 domain-containing protein [Rhodospirillales bacterium]|nr:DUF1653 domain-containing protein [Rhodospirillales bacterium]MCB9965864.1 DUF1653 domain-containing protein [Rhodospirillales bacterium]MCB9973375.1 DUF1653 domain-containing protein [Rhodospirillales bacterium]
MGQKYRHYKGNTYNVIGMGKHTETLEEFVIYQDSREKEKIWIRPKAMFFETVEMDGKTIPRFEEIE